MQVENRKKIKMIQSEIQTTR